MGGTDSEELDPSKQGTQGGPGGEAHRVTSRGVCDGGAFTDAPIPEDSEGEDDSDPTKSEDGKGKKAQKQVLPDRSPDASDADDDDGKLFGL